MKNILIALFHVLDYLDQFKALKENLLRGVGPLYTLRTPTYLRLSQKPQFVFFFLLKPSLSYLCSFGKHNMVELLIIPKKWTWLGSSRVPPCP